MGGNADALSMRITNRFIDANFGLASAQKIKCTQVNQKLLYRENDWWDVGLLVQKARKQGTVC